MAHYKIDIYICIQGGYLYFCTVNWNSKVMICTWSSAHWQQASKLSSPSRRFQSIWKDWDKRAYQYNTILIWPSRLTGSWEPIIYPSKRVLRLQQPREQRYPVPQVHAAYFRVSVIHRKWNGQTVVWKRLVWMLGIVNVPEKGRTSPVLREAPAIVDTKKGLGVNASCPPCYARSVLKISRTDAHERFLGSWDRSCAFSRC